MSLPVLEAVVIQELNIENKSINEITQESANIAKNLNEENLKKPFKVSGFSNDKQYIYIMPCHIEKDYLCLFSADIAQIISKKRGNDIIVLDENKKEIYNGDLNNYFYNNILQEPKTKCLGSINDAFGSHTKVTNQLCPTGTNQNQLPVVATPSPLYTLLTSIDPEEALNKYCKSLRREDKNNYKKR